MACMFTMMNQARLAVGAAGRRHRRARDPAGPRVRQGAQAGPRRRRASRGQARSSRIPDVKRMLLTMRALTRAARAICYTTARRARSRQAQHRCRRTQGRARARLAAHAGRQGVLRPTSASRSPRSACRCTAAWASSRRPAPPSTIATPASLRSTKAPTASRRSTSSPASCRLSGGATVRTYIAELRHTVEAVNVNNDPAFGWTGAPARGRRRQPRSHDAMAAEPPAERSGHAAGGSHALSAAVRTGRRRRHAGRARRSPRKRTSGNGADAAARIALARFFAENVAVAAGGLERIVFEGADSVNHAEAALA